MKSQGSSQQLPDTGKLGRELFGMIFIFCGILLTLSLASFDSRDPWLNHVLSGVTKVHNMVGLFGAYLGGFLLDAFGIASWVAPVFFFLAGARRALDCDPWPWWRWLGFFLLAVCLALAGASRDMSLLEMAKNLPGGGNVSTHGGGLLGHSLYNGLVKGLNSGGAFLVWLLTFLLSLQMLIGFSWLTVVAGAAAGIWKTCSTMAGTSTDDSPAALARKPRKAHLPSSEDSDSGKEDWQAEPSSSRNSPLWERLRRDGIFLTLSTFFGGYSTDSTDATPLDIAAPHFPSTTVTNRASSSEFRAEDPINSRNSSARVIDRMETSQAMSTEDIVHLPVDSAVSSLPTNDDETDLPPWVQAFERDEVGAPSGSVVSSVPSATAAGGETSVSTAAYNAAKALFSSSASSRSAVGSASVSTPSFSSAGDMSALNEVDPNITIRDAVVIESAGIPESPGLLQSAVSLIKRPTRIPLPPLALIEAVPPAAGSTTRAQLEVKGKTLMACLTDFGIQGELVGITPGPVVTMFEVRPAPGVRVSRIANLSDDLALALKAVAVRIQAPVPGTDTVGIEIPNEVRETVCLRELLASQAFQKSASPLTLALGKDIAGGPAVADLATMPHLLVAGATGAGKSVGINSIILSLLYKARPEEVKFLLVDPKRVEMAIYADLPHLVHPVVTEMSMAKNALEWAVSEMERRYSDIARAGVRNIIDYNAKLANVGDKRPDSLIGLETMPYLVIVIDELADLMLVAAKEVETSIVRLAQLARAAGIHLILATQRPSVDVVTGLIKANFPCRISFQVSSKHDSRTILDTVGAEHLLGKGDMLFKPGGGKFQRMHGAFVNDASVLGVVDYWRSRQKPDYRLDFSEWGAADSTDSPLSGNADIAADPMYAEAVEFVRSQGRASISLIQRRFRIGFNKAARFVEQMEQDGLIGPADGSKPRVVIR